MLPQSSFWQFGLLCIADRSFAMYSTLAVALALAQSTALLAPRAPVALRGVSVCSSPPGLSYAADKAKDAPEEEITDASFVGQYLRTNQP